MSPHGFIDLHTHGIGRYDTRTANPLHILKMAELLGRAGTIAFLPTIYPGPIDEMRTHMEAVRKAMEIQKPEAGTQKSGGSTKSWQPAVFKRQINNIRQPATPEENSSRITHHASLILGVHLEGPFLNPLRSGALDKDSFIRPSISSLKKLVEGYEEIVRVITVAPEMPGALKVIERCSETGIIVNMGHSDATYAQAADGKKAGATGVTHLFNAMRTFHHREPGLAGFGLLDQDIYIEVIADGVHLHRDALRLIFSTKPHDRIILVTDSVRGAKSGGKPAYAASGILSGSGSTIPDSLEVLEGLGLSKRQVLRVTVENQRVLLTKKSISCKIGLPLKPPV